MIPLHADLLTILDAVEILSPTRYALRGEPRDLPTPIVASASPAGSTAGEPPLVSSLESELYGRFYVRPSTPGVHPPADWLARRDLLAALSAANTGQGSWEPGWTIRHLDEDGWIAVAREDVSFWVAATGLRVQAGQIRPGAACRVWVAKELRRLMPGFYVAIGDGEGDDDDSGDQVEPLVRYYWHLTSAATVSFMDAATTLLNAAKVPFRVKVLSDPNAYQRADAGVLYLRRRYCARLGDSIARIHAAVASDLRPDVPLFTKRLADGLGLAEDPAGGMSFGQHRCRLTAQALRRSFARGDADADLRAATLAAAFQEAELAPSRPYLEPRSRDDYAFRPSPAVPRRRSERSPSARGRRAKRS